MDSCHPRDIGIGGWAQSILTDTLWKSYQCVVVLSNVHHHLFFLQPIEVESGEHGSFKVRLDSLESRRCEGHRIHQDISLNESQTGMRKEGGGVRRKD